VHRKRVKTGAPVKAVTYVAASAVAGTMAGGFLGAVGNLLPQDTRLAIASISAITAVGIGVVESMSPRLRPPQFDRETPQRWLLKGSVSWAIRNGSVLGIGATSRIGFWMWYMVPLGSLLSGQALLGALIYGAYGLTRGGSSLGIILGARLSDFDRVASWLVMHKPTARLLSGSGLIVVGISCTVVLAA
jgi:hypothetical protein